MYCCCLESGSPSCGESRCLYLDTEEALGKHTLNEWYGPLNIDPWNIFLIIMRSYFVGRVFGAHGPGLLRSCPKLKFVNPCISEWGEEITLRCSEPFCFHTEMDRLMKCFPRDSSYGALSHKMRPERPWDDFEDKGDKWWEKVLRNSIPCSWSDRVKEWQ